MQDKKLYKSRTDKKINGVCGGIAKYVGIDATAIRLAWGFLSCVYGIGVIAYIVAALVIPVEPEEQIEDCVISGVVSEKRLRAVLNGEKRDL